MKTTQETGLEIASSFGNTSSLDILLEKQNKANDVKKLINLAKKSLKNNFGVTLEEEIQHLDF